MTKHLAFILAATLAGCAAQAEVRYSGDASNPELVPLDTNPGVMVVANAEEPIFLVQHTYWLYRDNSWYSSSSHVSGWQRTSDLPLSVTRIQQPATYVHYHHSGAPARAEVRDHREPPPAAPSMMEVRDHREPNGQGPVPPHANPLPPNQVPPAGAGPHNGPDQKDRGGDQRPDHP